MRSTLSAFLAAAALVAALGLALAAPHAVSADGAQPTGGPVNVNDCTDYGVVTICSTANGEQHRLCTPSGGCHSQINLTSECSTVTDDMTGVVLLYDCQSLHAQFHSDQAGALQVYFEASVDTYTDSTGQTHCLSIRYHEVDGQVQYESVTTDC